MEEVLNLYFEENHHNYKWALNIHKIAIQFYNYLLNGN